jgi:hypothetical protein
MAEKTYEWFVGTDEESRLLSPLQRLNNDREKWNLTALSTAEDKGSLFTDAFAEDPAKLYNITKSDVEERIERLVDEDSSASVQLKAASKLYLATKAFDNWKSDRRTGKIRKAGSGLQKVLCTIGDFLQGFSGIAEIIKGADQQYGGLAYGTVMLMTSVAVHKQKREESIEEALEELAYAFPRLELLQRVRPNDNMRKLIVEVFELVIIFCRETAAYFAHKMARLLKTLSPKEQKMNTLARLRIKLSEIHKECAVMMLEELADTRKQLDDVQRHLRRIELTGDDTNIRVREGHEHWARKSRQRAKEAYLGELKPLLAPKQPDYAPDSTIVTRYKKVLRNEFSDHGNKQQSAVQMSPKLLNDEELFSTWLNGTGSSILMLGGNNWLDDSSLQLNWLSYASIIVVEEVYTHPKTCLLTFFCQSDYTVPKRKRCFFPDVLNSLIFQLAQQHPDGLRVFQEEIRDAVKSPLWQVKGSLESFEAMTKLLAKLMASFEEGTIFTVVIDRLDQCRWSDDPDDEANELDKAVASLIYLIQNSSISHLVVKVLLVMDGAPAKDIAKTMVWARKSRAIQWKVDWDQETDAYDTD